MHKPFDKVHAFILSGFGVTVSHYRWQSTITNILDMMCNDLIDDDVGHIDDDDDNT